MTPNRIDTDGITIVNVFEIESGKLYPFLAIWCERAEFLSRQPGFRSLRVLRAASEGAHFQVVSVTAWDDVDALQAATGGAEFEQSARVAVNHLGVVAYPGVYRTALAVSAHDGGSAVEP
jgi:heme-degrading monooxygenase HmoA